MVRIYKKIQILTRRRRLKVIRFYFLFWYFDFIYKKETPVLIGVFCCVLVYIDLYVFGVLDLYPVRGNFNRCRSRYLATM